MNKEEIKFIDRLYRDLYLSDSVEKHTTSKDKYRRIKEYMEKLEEIHNGMISHNHIDTLKKMYYDKYVIKEEAIPNSYYEHEQEMALERGYGHIELTENSKRELNKIIISDQKKSLDTWLDYFLSDDSNYIPFWAKYWAFQGMLKLGSFDKEKGKYTKRSKHTVTKFADLNREALALSIDYLLKYLNREEISDKELEGLVHTGSFGSIYTYIITKVLSNNTNITKRNVGKWIKYDRGTDHMPLVKSLQGYNTGWCTAGEATAKTQLANGDFYVYYTLDENDEYKVPRIAIRMEGNKIGEIRGVAQNQNLELEMEEVVTEKIKDFPGKDKYYKKVSDMETLTKIYKKQQNKEEFTKEELNFLYETQYEIEGFGYKKDPRIEEIISMRNIKSDIAIIKDLDESQVGISITDLHEKKEYFYGDILLQYDKKISDNIIMPNEVQGSLFLNSLVDADNLELSNKIHGNLNLENLKEVSNLKLPEIVYGKIDLSNLSKATQITFPKMCGSLNLEGLKYFDELECPKIVNGSLHLDSVKEINNVKLPEVVKGNLTLGVKKLENYKLPKKIGALIGCNTEVVKNIDLSSVYFMIDLKSVIKMENVIFPEEISYDLNLSSLPSCKGIKLPKKIDGSLFLISLNSIKGIELPEIVSGGLFLNSLKSADYLSLPDNIEVLYLDDLVDTKNLKLPKNIRRSVCLGSLTKNDLTLKNLPDELNYKIYLKDDIIDPSDFKSWKEEECNYGKEKRRNN